MHVVERGVDEALVIGDVIVRVLEITNSGEVRVAVSSPNGGSRYQEFTLRVEGSVEEKLASIDLEFVLND
jgi:sRNA-binding carbon storage regulator CsrA